MTKRTKIGLSLTLLLVGGCTAWLVPAVQSARIAAQRSADK